jgi:hypothetical protein
MHFTYTTQQAWDDLTQWHDAPDVTSDLGDGRPSDPSASPVSEGWRDRLAVRPLRCR